jgi:hypothetical protein
MNKTTALLMVVIMSLCFIIGTTMTSKAQIKIQGKSFNGVVPFITTTDRVGFFDQNTGKIYIYDSNVSQCLFTGQIQNLGDPILPITAQTTS